MSGVVGYVQNLHKFSDIPPQIGEIYTCDTPFSDNNDIFDVYLTESAMAQVAIEYLCKDTVIKRQFGNVRITVGQNDYDTFRYINHGVAELALVKSNVVEAFSADRIYGYDAFAAHPDYSAYFIALKEKPILSKEYLLGKRIGILDYPSSRSGHIVPKYILKSLDLSETTVNIRYYNSHKELRRALLAGEVDIISSYWSIGDDEQLSRNYITPLEETVSGMRWYLKMQTRNTDLRCALQQDVLAIAANHPRSYYRDIELLNKCGDNG